MRITLKHLKVFIEVAKAESISEGAKSCFISQSAASISLGQLEKILEIKLFDRNKNGLSLNSDGKALFKKAIEIIEKSNEFELFNKSNENLQGDISVAANSVIATYVLPKLLYKFQTEYPNIKINIISDNLDKTFANIENEICEIGFVEGRVLLHEMKSEEIIIKKSELKIICNKNHPLAKYDSVNIDDVFGYKWAYYHDTFTTRDILITKIDKNSNIMRKWAGDYDVKENIVLGDIVFTKNGDMIKESTNSFIDDDFYLPNIEAVKVYVSNSDFLATVPNVSLSEIDNNSLKVINVKNIVMTRNHRIILKKNKHHTKIVKLFCDWLQKQEY
ncbi:LysR family transcriptional regulator [Francisella sp. XLW-1]|uniref:LysR family transcriptional regulator n=1 Tax=Francisella sp. XLW-1 TaxID=2610887 RepID=UPI00123E4572|nr:LysR family transcriptional regulator [Francisella sp. XLW-1]